MSTKRAIAAQILNQQVEYAQTLNRKARAVSIATSPPLFEGSRCGEGSSPNARDWQELRPFADQRDDKRRPGQYTARPRTAEFSALRPHQELHPIKRGIGKAVAQEVYAGWVGPRLLQSAPSSIF